MGGAYKMIQNNLREYIDEKEITISFISQKTGIRYATLLNIINGNISKINLKYLAAIMDAINISDFNLIFKKE